MNKPPIERTDFASDIPRGKYHGAKTVVIVCAVFGISFLICRLMLQYENDKYHKHLADVTKVAEESVHKESVKFQQGFGGHHTELQGVLGCSDTKLNPTAYSGTLYLLCGLPLVPAFCRFGILRRSCSSGAGNAYSPSDRRIWLWARSSLTPNTLELTDSMTGAANQGLTGSAWLCLSPLVASSAQIASGVLGLGPSPLGVGQFCFLRRLVSPAAQRTAVPGR